MNSEGRAAKSLNELRDVAHRIAVEHGFKDATIAEDFALMHSEISEALEDHRAGKKPNEVWYEEKKKAQVGDQEIAYAIVHDKMYPPSADRLDGNDVEHPYKPCGIPSELADVIIRVLHFSGKHGIDIERAVREKMIYNETRPFKHGNKML